EIARRRSSLTVSTYTYRGARGRRDPWIDPRVPLEGPGGSVLSVQEQMELVQDLVDRTQAVVALWEQYKLVDGVVAELTTRNELETTLAKLEEEVRRIDSDKS